MVRVLITILVAIAGWQIAKFLKLPAPGMLGSMILVGVTNIFFSYATFTSPIKVFGLALSGAYVGQQIRKKDLLNFKYLVIPFLILILLLTANTFVAGAIIHYVCNMDWLTSLLSCVAGGVTDMSILAMDLGADASIVAMMQTCRLIGVLLIFPYWIPFLCKNEPKAEDDERMKQNVELKDTFLDKLINTPKKKFYFTLIFSYICGYIGLWSGFPAGAMVFPMIIIMILNVTTKVCSVPKSEKLVAQILAGMVVGCGIKAETFSSLSTTLIPVLILLASYFIINYFFSKYCKKKNYLDMKSAMFASAPGGATDMTLIAADLGADLTKIALIQVLRAIYVLAVMPSLVIFFIQLVS